ncbi:CAAX amino terminal protease self- immunity family protein [Pediococcus claussenii ATCC BAA-344]|uniref:CAAX amino terminal protease self-immunity family protein n=1 Tax=Pediococcus claussenii (strain ATCC BAA-344 / DSM 14800 / JCM 18046 / KCTC 3811 / LMG 21948 / P06) TaxID=701521 RepID=G8PBF1_PEDCP|nr:CAAX amino terminal protease self- immunity family protein [Pediococcus claussenii ATCC BAA-344]
MVKSCDLCCYFNYLQYHHFHVTLTANRRSIWDTSRTSKSNGPPFLLMFSIMLTVVLISPIIEELIFQYFFQRVFLPTLNISRNIIVQKYVSIISPTLLFILSHIITGNISFQSIFIGLITYLPLLFLSILYERTDQNIVYPIAVHILINFMGMISIS